MVLERAQAMSVIDKKEYLPSKKDRILGGTLGAVAGCFGGGCVLLILGIARQVLDMHDAADSIFLNPTGMGFIGAGAGGLVVGVYLGGKHLAYDRIVIGNALKGADQPDE